MCAITITIIIIIISSSSSITTKSIIITILIINIIMMQAFPIHTMACSALVPPIPNKSQRLTLGELPIPIATPASEGPSKLGCSLLSNVKILLKLD